MGDFIGPIIPGNLKQRDDQLEGDDTDEESNVIGPALPPGWKKDEDEDNSIIGPVLPTNLIKKRPLDDRGNEYDPQSLNKKKEPKRSETMEKTRKVIGPTLPPGFGDKHENRNKGESSYNVQSEITGDAEGSDEEEDDDEFTIGPLPPSGNFIQVEESRHQRSQVASGSKGPQREEWIASLPENSSVAHKLGFGKHMTSFSSKPVSIKEITPVDQDNELDKAVDEYNKVTRPEPLVDLHKKKMKDQKKEEAPTRQLFDFNPEEDLKVRQLDSQQTKSIVEKAKLLNSRFSNPRGQKKFL